VSGASADDPRRSRPPTPLRTAAESVLRAYAGVYFSSRRSIGLLLLLATFWVPSHGLVGLLGLALTQGAAWLLGVDPDGRRSGFYALNGLLVGLALGMHYRFGPELVLLVALASFVTMAISAAARSLAELYLAVPVLSLPFVLSTWVVLLAARRFAGLEWALDPIYFNQVGADWLPAPLSLYLRSLSAALFQLSVPAGLLVFGALLLASRWSVLLSILGYVAGLLTYTALGGRATDLSGEIIGFNFVLTAIAVGGIYVRLSPASMGLAALAGSLAAAVSAATLSLLAPLGLPPLAFPFIITTHALLYALGRRLSSSDRLALVRGVPGSPEANLLASLDREGRYPDPALPLVYLPVMGEWWLSQGWDGEHTHQGLWRHAWDFEVRDEDGNTARGDGLRPEDYLCYGLPVLSPGDGQVVHAVGHLPDSARGEVDIQHNWGNCLVIWHGGRVYSLLAHLRPGSLKVGVGEQVVTGQLLAQVGSSGRAPRPHLHFHVQAGPLPGAATLAAQILHYAEMGSEGTTRYRTHGVPREGDHVRALSFSEQRREALSFPLDRIWRWRVRRGKQETLEQWLPQIDLLGARSLVSDAGGSHLDLFGDRAYTTAVRYEGPRFGLLQIYLLGCPRAPHSDEDLVWEDRLPPGRVLSGWRKLLYELALPFGALLRVRSSSRFDPDSAGMVIETELRPEGLLAGAGLDLPNRIRVSFVPQVGPVRIEALRGGRPWLDAAIEP